MNNLMLSQLWQPESTRHYKVHFARWNREQQPLHVLARDINEWAGWQAWFPNRNDFNRKFIFSLAQYPSAPDYWLFGGIWRVHGLVERDFPGGRRKFYEVELAEDLRPLVARLKLRRVWKERGTRVKLEHHYESFEVAEILPDPYTGRPFPGFERVHLTFQELEELVSNARADWAASLGSIKGVYLITDDYSGRQYVGSAYGDDGIWSRWSTYVRLGHGGNKGMKDLLRGHDLDYCREYFRFALLEMIDARTADSHVIQRESYWKDVLGTRHRERGLNRN